MAMQAIIAAGNSVFFIIEFHFLSAPLNVLSSTAMANVLFTLVLAKSAAILRQSPSTIILHAYTDNKTAVGRARYVSVVWIAVYRYSIELHVAHFQDEIILSVIVIVNSVNYCIDIADDVNLHEALVAFAKERRENRLVDIQTMVGKANRVDNLSARKLWVYLHERQTHHQLCVSRTEHENRHKKEEHSGSNAVAQEVT